MKFANFNLVKNYKDIKKRKDSGKILFRGLSCRFKNKIAITRVGESFGSLDIVREFKTEVMIIPFNRKDKSHHYIPLRCLVDSSHKSRSVDNNPLFPQALQGIFPFRW